MRDEKSKLVPPTTDILRGSAVACAQSMLQNAMDRAGLTSRGLAKKMGVDHGFVSRMMADSLTIDEFAWALAECGYRATFGFAPITSRWNPDALH